MPLPFPGLDRVNAYLLTDDRGCTLVDCGMYLPDDETSDHGWDDLVAALAACDRKPSDIERLVVTHTHIDHYGLAARLKGSTGCEIWIHLQGLEELDLLRNPEVVVEQLRETYADHGISGEKLDELTSFEDWRRFVADIIDADRWLSDGDSFEVGARSWQVIHTPGHANSHICLFDSEQSLMISGDHLLATITPHIDFRRGQGDPLGDFLESLEKVEKLAPRIVLPGHGRPFEDGAERARATVRHHERRLGAIVQVVRREARSADQITDEIFGSTLLHFQKRLALGEALAHIHYLRLRGELERTDSPDGTRLYRKASRRLGVEVPE